MYLLIGVWGGPRRVYAAIKFVLFTMAGSVLMLVGILVLAVIHQQMVGSLSFDLFDLLRTPVPADLEPWLFAAFALAFAIKVPIFPLHTWLPDAHVEAPTAGSVLLAGILLKMGVYGYLRFAIPLFPQAARDFAPLFAVLGIVGIIYGALVAMVQPDVKKLVAYSSVSHLGFVVLGTFVFNAQGVSGGILQMVNHGLSTGALFLLVGMIYERRHTRMIADFGGLAKTMPVYATFFLIVMLSSIGLPGLNGFVGEFTILLGTFRANMTYAVLATTGVILAAWYMLGMYQRVFHGWPTGVQTAEAATGHHNHHHGGDHQTSEASEDLTWREIGILVPIVIVIVLIGVYPGPFFQVMGPSVEALIGLVR
jgi:NADH-quinone oxidoreductase subunit M